MGKCSYTWEEWDSEKGEFVERQCPRETWGGSDEFCIFHDPSPEKDVDLFKEKLEEQLQSETDRYCFVGYVFPEGSCDFENQEFAIDANFGGATFQGTAYFWEATFQDTADFRKATFQDANFWEATFQDAYFGGATFQDADFRKATFQRADFRKATFQRADFRKATFQRADFRKATFQDADFWEATFQDADFGGVTVEKTFEFAPAKNKILDFQNAKFLFRANITADLTLTRFHRAYLDNVAFIDCIWPGKIYEEVHIEDIELSYNQLETIYRDLKQNMQNHGDYKKAGDFYYREMEMRRKGAETKKDRIWLELYRIMAGYGEKPQLVIRNSLLVILVVAALFFFCGVARVGTELPPEENPDIIDYSLDSFAFNTETLKDFGYCLYYSVVTFTTLGYGDIHPLGYSHALASAEALTGAFFMALFVVVFARKMMR
jgi:uncharacterized protein YjbI with pentapeptide repeats